MLSRPVAATSPLEFGVAPRECRLQPLFAADAVELRTRERHDTLKLHPSRSSGVALL